MLFDRLIRKRVTTFEQEIMQKYYAEVESMYTKMRGWRHDYRHHIQAMKVYAADGRLEEIQDYLSMLDPGGGKGSPGESGCQGAG